MSRISRVATSVVRTAAVALLCIVAAGAAPEPDSLAVSVDRITACGSAWETLNPDACLPGGLSTVFAEGCPSGQTWCASSCCRCCNPIYQVCCDATCTGVCTPSCPSCYKKRET